MPARVTLDDLIHQPRIAYFSMEIALRSEIPTYAGGLGVLAGDTLRSAKDLGLPMVAVSLVSRHGYFRQELDAKGRQVEQPEHWDPASWAELLDAKIAITLESRRVWIGAWLYVMASEPGTPQPVLLLDTDLPENSAPDREITNSLYGGDAAYRLKQEIVLGAGGVRMLQALGFAIRQYHLNEGHSAFLGLELLRSYRHPDGDLRPGESPYDIPRVREMCCFTTHTPVEAGQDRFPYALVAQISGGAIGYEAAAPDHATSCDLLVDQPTLKWLAGEEQLNMTRLALNLSEYVNGVAKRHADTSDHMFPGYRMHAITNGVHPATWTAEGFARLYDHYLPGWRHEPELLSRADVMIPDAALWDAHLEAKQRLIRTTREQLGVELDARLPILGYARRMTAYKRPTLLFGDLQRLRAIAREQPLQIVLAGKAHPRDEAGKVMIEQLAEQARLLRGAVQVVYLPNYDMQLAQILTAGADVWVNTPLPPLEASGTSGMKAAFNGVPSLSVLDGWWVEGCVEGVTGWAIGNGEARSSDGASLYDRLEQVVLPLYYRSAEATRPWVALMKGAISKNASYFNSHRMMRRYGTEAYVR
jgi:glycogen phosphorylase